MAGRNKQTLEVIKGKNKSHHLTKDEISKRKKHEKAMQGFSDNISPPAYLTAAEKKEFENLSEELIRLNIFSNLDVDSLARYINSKTQYIQLTKQLKKIKPVKEVKNDDGDMELVENDAYIKLMRSKNLLFNECRTAATELGLNITSRLKLVTPETKEEKPQSKFAKFGGG